MTKEELRKEIGLRMRKLRKKLSYTQDQMVSNFNIGRANYSRIEKGEIFPVATILNTLRKELNVSLDWLISNEGEMFLQERKERTEKVDFGEYTEEVRDLLFHLHKIPMVKHAVLGFFIEYKLKNENIIDPILEADKIISKTAE